MTTECFIIDIDGTIANGDHRVQLAKEKRWDEYFEACHLDEPIEHMWLLLQCLDMDWRSDLQLIYVSGRPERIRQKTLDWMDKYGFPLGDGLYMRQDGDHRPDTIVKKEILNILRARGFEPVMAFDDRNSVVKMWRDNGVPCAQVVSEEEGNF